VSGSVGGEALFAAAGWRCVELAPSRIPQLQAFFEANPEYHVTVNGEPPRPDEARDEYESMPPAGWPFGRKWVLGYVERGDEMVGMADVLSDLFAPGIWHLGTFIVATRLHGSGAAAAMYEALEAWMRANDARWLRLGVVAGNARAERFWEKRGYRELRRREGVAMGRKVNAIRVMAKPLVPGEWSDYFDKVGRDRPDSN
jgi:ribosomal protein S18 acetylase RimI-like enzyme